MKIFAIRAGYVLAQSDSLIHYPYLVGKRGDADDEIIAPIVTFSDLEDAENYLDEFADKFERRTNHG